MDINDMLRRLGRHRLLLVVCAALPPLVVLVVGLVAPPSYSATTRLVVSASNPGTETEADAVMNRATGVATSSAVVGQALASLPAPQQAPVAEVIPEVGVTRLGSSPVVDVTVTDRDPARATALATALGPRVVNVINNQGSQGAAQLVAALNAQRNQLLDRRQQLARQLTAGGDSPNAADVSSQLSSLDQQLSDLGASIGQAQSSSLSLSSAAVISLPGQAVRAPGHTAATAALALVLGVLAGVVVAAGIEFVAPRVVDARSYAREADLAYLGKAQLDPDPDPDPNPEAGTGADTASEAGADTGTAAREASGSASVTADDPLLPTLLAQAAERRAAEAVFLVGPVEQAVLAGLARRLDDRLSARARDGAASGPVSNGVAQPATGDTGGVALRTSPRRTTAVPARVRVRSLHDVGVTGLGDEGTAARSALVVVLPDRARYRDVEAVRDVERATGWPLIAVIAGVHTKGAKR